MPLWPKELLHITLNCSLSFRSYLNLYWISSHSRTQLPSNRSNLVCYSFSSLPSFHSVLFSCMWETLYLSIIMSVVSVTLVPPPHYLVTLSKWSSSHVWIFVSHLLKQTVPLICPSFHNCTWPNYDCFFRIELWCCPPNWTSVSKSVTM